MVKSDSIRKTFLKFFETKGHRIVPSYSLIPPKDPTLLFVNAGMVQFKDVFTGVRDLGFKRATTTQKCLRVSGKHNDLEQVGRTPRHHTFFEMLGNFSFGDYFKREAISYAWELLTKGYGLKEQDLWVTIHPEDAQAREIWIKEIGLSPQRIIEDPTNFWAMGETGPCGPCSEIHIDRGPSFPGKDMYDPQDRFMELWNLVFMQYNRDSAGNLSPLPAPSIDTGMGLERICAVLQEKRSNFETDLFMPLIERTEEISGKRYGNNPEDDVAFRVIADHARATAFLIADGIYPDNEGRGYVLRRLMRRALRFGYKLKIDGCFFTNVVLEVINTMGDVFPELKKGAYIVEKITDIEEKRFLKTLASGMELLNNEIEKTKAEGKSELSGDTVFVLYDTHGFPVDLTEMIASEHGLGIDIKTFDIKMEEQKDRGRVSWKGGGQEWEYLIQILSEIKVKFLGYETEEAWATITGIFKEGQMVERIAKGEKGVVVTDSTPFYGESGGQVGDTGIFRNGDENLIQVIDTKRLQSDLIVHLVRVVDGEFHVADRVFLSVDKERRQSIRRNHSATHLLHKALRKLLGTHVRQRGSYVGPERLRFDFSHFGPMTDQEIAEVEEEIYRDVLADHQIITEVLPIQEAIEKGALHFFEEKYEEVVRLVSMGESRELCGGTHCKRTGEIGLVKIISETGISAGVRRLECVTGFEVLKYIKEKAGLVSDICNLLRIDEKGVRDKINKMIEEEKILRKEINEIRRKGMFMQTGEVTRVVSGVKVVQASLKGVDVKGLKEVADTMRDEIRSGLVLLTRPENGKLTVILGVTPDLAQRYPANVLLKNMLAKFGGKGGGSALLAQGGTSDTDVESKLLDALVEILRS